MRNFAIARPKAKIRDCPFGIGQIHFTSIFDDRHNKPLRRANSNPDIIVILIDNISAINFGIYRRKFTKRLNGRLHKHTHKTKPDFMRGFECVFIISPQFHQRRHIHLVKGGQHRRAILRRFQPCGNDLPQFRHANTLFTRRINRPRCCPWWCWRICSCRDGLRRCRLRLVDRRQNIGLGQTPANTCCRNICRIEFMFINQPPHCR